MAAALSFSLPPSPYLPPVSIRVAPRSSASLTVAISSARCFGSSPICQVPSPKAGTCSPEGRVTTCIAVLSDIDRDSPEDKRFGSKLKLARGSGRPFRRPCQRITLRDYDPDREPPCDSLLRR